MLHSWFIRIALLLYTGLFQKNNLHHTSEEQNYDGEATAGGRRGPGLLTPGGGTSHHHLLANNQLLCSARFSFFVGWVSFLHSK